MFFMRVDGVGQAKPTARGKLSHKLSPCGAHGAALVDDAAVDCPARVADALAVEAVAVVAAVQAALEDRDVKHQHAYAEAVVVSGDVCTQPQCME